MLRVAQQAPKFGFSVTDLEQHERGVFVRLDGAPPQLLPLLEGEAVERGPVAPLLGSGKPRLLFSQAAGHLFFKGVHGRLSRATASPGLPGLVGAVELMVVATTSCAQHGPGSQAPSEACQSLADPLLRRQSSSSKEKLWPPHGQQELDGPRHFCLGVYGSKVRAVDDTCWPSSAFCFAKAATKFHRLPFRACWRSARFSAER